MLVAPSRKQNSIRYIAEINPQGGKLAQSFIEISNKLLLWSHKRSNIIVFLNEMEVQYIFIDHAETAIWFSSFCEV